MNKFKLIFLILITVFLCNRDVSAKAIKVYNYEDFCDKLCIQVLNHTEQQFYEMPSYDMAKSVLDSKLASNFSYHYNENNPLESGCYLQSFVDTFLMTAYSNRMFSMRIMYKYSADEMNDHLENIKKIAATLKRDTDFDTVLAVHDYLVDNFVYDDYLSVSEFNNHSDLEGFRDGRMVCSGYSFATYYMLNYLGVKTRIIFGYGGETTTGPENHAWNIVNLDGTWYNLDVTWDDFSPGKKDYTYFLKNDEDFKNHIRSNHAGMEKIGDMISKTSYKLPKELRGDNTLYKIGAIITGVLIFIVIVLINKRREAGLPF